MMPEVGEQARSAYEDVAAGLAGEGVVKGSMFGMPCLKFGKKVLGGVWGDAMNFKLAPGDLRDALELKGAEQFDPGMGRPMKEWVVVPYEHVDRWPELAKQALDYLRG